MKPLFMAAMLIAAGMVFPARAADGDLDPSFSFDGKVTTDFNGFGDRAASVAIDPSGRIVVAGATYDGTQQDFGVARYNEDGALDTSFGTNGLVTIDFNGGSDTGQSVAIDGLGRIIVAGSSQDPNGRDFAVARLNDDGTLDTSFNGTGKVTTDFAVNAAEKILVVGSANDFSATKVVLVRYNEDGTLDDSLDGDNQGDGKVVFDFGSVSVSGSAITLDADGKIVLVGDSGGDFLVARCHADGTLDHDFNGTGWVTTDIEGHGDAAKAVALDAGFHGGVVLTDFDNNSSGAGAVALDATGRIVVAGRSRDDFGLVRLLSNSVPPCGFTCTPSFTVPTDSGTCAAVVTYHAPTTKGSCLRPRRMNYSAR